MNNWKNQARRFWAFWLSVILFVTGIPVPSFADSGVSSYLGGWTVQAAWSTFSTEYEWNAKEEEVRQPKLVVTYRMNHAKTDYPAGSLVFQIPGIGKANRSQIVKASQLAADEADSEWDYEWNQEQDVYTFTNRFEVAEGQSISGGFELLWNLNARDLEDRFVCTESPSFSVVNVGSIGMKPLTFRFQSMRDRYRIELSRDKLYDEDYDAADDSCIWYEFSTRFDKDWMARGLYKSDYYVTVTLPEEQNYEDVVVKYGDEECELIQDADGNWGFYPFQGRSGDLGDRYSSHYEYFTLGFRKSTLLGQEITVHGHLDRLYHDEGDWVRTAGEQEVVDAELSFTAEDYHFDYSGYIYSHDKWNTDYESGHSAPSNYSNRLNAVNLYNGKVVQFILRGKANRTYSAAYGLRRMAATASDAEPIPEDIVDWNDIRWKEHERDAVMADWGSVIYGERYPERIASWSDAERASDSNVRYATEANADYDFDEEEDEFDFGEIFLIPDILIKGVRDAISCFKRRNPFLMTAYASMTTPAEAEEAVYGTGISQIGENQEYSMVLGDDKLVIFRNDGSIRNLEDDEYDIVYVTVPSDSKGYDYEIYGTNAQDTPFEEYVRVGSGNTAQKQTTRLPDGIKAVFVRVNGITGTYQYQAYMGVRLHLDWAEQQGLESALRPDHENRLVNFSYMRALYVDNDGYERNDCSVDTENYGGTYGRELAELDEMVYEEYLKRDYSNVWLRSAVTSLDIDVELNSFEGGGRFGFENSVTSTGRILADNTGSLERFSIYTVLPDGLHTDLDAGEIAIAGQGRDMFGETVTNLDDYAMISTGELNGKAMIIADFDCSGNPLEISQETRISVTIPVTLSYLDYLEYGNRYTVKSYLMVHDDGVDRISGKALMSDTYDLDRDGVVEEKMAYDSAYQQVSDQANEWREYAFKSVKSTYSNDYVTDTVTRIYSEQDGEEEQEKSRYSYRLEFGLGSDHARNIIFYDRLEQGAVVQQDAEDESVEREIESQWQGQFVSVDTSYARQMGMKPTVYYSENPEQEFDLSASGWTTVLPDDKSRVKSIAVELDTSDMESGMMQTQQMTYVLIHMRAPSESEFCDKKAVNQYTVQYDAYGLTDLFEETYRLSSSETTVRLLDTVGKIVLQKVDADHLIRTDEDGREHFSPVTGARFQVYDRAGNPLFDEAKELSSLGRITVKNIPYGTYYWEEVEAPPGYERIAGLHAFEIDGVTEILEIPNHRIPGTVTLVKKDADALEDVALENAVFELYHANGSQVFTDDDYTYSEGGTQSAFVTDGTGQIVINGLPWGSYYFVEIQAPTGYELDSDRVSFTVGKAQYDAESGLVKTEVTAYNTQKTASITLKKTDRENQDAIKDAVFSLYQESEEDKLLLSGLKTNAAGEIVVEDLKFGTYYFIETRNAGGYQMPDEEAARTEAVVLDASTAEQMVEISHTNERRLGRVRMVKNDNTGMLVGGAEYGLYYRSEADDGYRLFGTYTTEADRSSEMFGEVLVENLPWGDYYFLETKAPKGYALSAEPIAFTVDRESVQNIMELETTDMLKDGSVRLIKTDRENQSLRLAGAVYELYRMDGTRCVAGVDYTLPEGASAIETGADGSILLMDIRQGAYYLREIKPPESYSISDELIRFSVTKENVDSVQELIAADEKGKAIITIRKEINEVYEAFGNPTFIFKITGDNNSEYVRTITLDEQNLSGEVSVEVDQGAAYAIRELPSARYELEEIILGAQAVLETDGTSVRIDLMTAAEGNVTFINRMEQYEKFSHTGYAANIVSAVTKLTAITAEYHGADPITMSGSGYDEDTEEYTISKADLTVLAHYDDGTSSEIPVGDCMLYPETVNGLSDSYTGTVTYMEDGITRTTSFSVGIDLPAPLPRYTVSFDLGGGTIIPDGENSMQESYSYTVKSGTEIAAPSNDPVLDGYRFLGWYEDKNLETAVVFPLVVDSDETIYAKWEEICVKVRYAVSIYGIQEDKDVNGNLVGLTFGPATGASYVSSSKSHEPAEEGQICMHGLEWAEIIAQSKADPNVFRECLKQGCTHTVQLKLKGPLTEGGISYPEMTGDGAGMLYYSLNSVYCKWNWENSTYFTNTNSYEYRYGANTGGWPDSAIRNALNGTVTEDMLAVSNKENGFDAAKLDESTALISGFPEELRHAIVEKKVLSDTIYDDYDNSCEVSYDKLWLFSSKELIKNTGSGKGKDAIRENEGTRYSRQDIMGITTSNGAPNIAYTEDGKAFQRWTRSLYPSLIAAFNGYMINEDGYSENNSMRTRYGIAPGFCLPGPS